MIYRQDFLKIEKSMLNYRDSIVTIIIIIFTDEFLKIYITGLTFEQSKVPERTAAMPPPCGCCVGSHCLGWSDSQWSPQQTSVRRSVVSEENLTTNIHHWQRRGGTLGCRAGRHH